MSREIPPTHFSMATMRPLAEQLMAEALRLAPPVTAAEDDGGDVRVQALCMAWTATLNSAGLPADLVPGTLGAFVASVVSQFEPKIQGAIVEAVLDQMRDSLAELEGDVGAPVVVVAGTVQ